MSKASPTRPDDASHEGLAEALGLLDELTREIGPTSWIGSAERQLGGFGREQVLAWLAAEAVGPETLEAALIVKRVAGQINVLVHALGILNSLPYILEPGEVVESLSLGAGNTGRRHDL